MENQPQVNADFLPLLQVNRLASCAPSPTPPRPHPFHTAAMTFHPLAAYALLLAISQCWAVSFPEDDEPINVVDYHYSKQYPVFRGRPSGNESQHKLDFQLMLKIRDTLYIAGRDQVYTVNLNDIPKGEVVPSKKLTWRSKQQDRENCAMKGKHKDECHNFIKVFVPRNDEMVFVCGTNAFNPMCRYYRVRTNAQTRPDCSLPKFKEHRDALQRFLINLTIVLLILFCLWRDRSISAHHSFHGQCLRSQNNPANVMGMVKRTKKLCLCNWTKSTMRCSLRSPAASLEFPSVVVSVMDRVKREKHPLLPRIELSAFQVEGKHFHQYTTLSTSHSAPPGSCAKHSPAEAYKTSIDFPDETLSFIKSHPLMDSAIPSVIEEPWFTKTRVRYRLTTIAVDHSAGPYQNYTVIFVGSEAGMVLKILAKTKAFSLNDSILLEEIDAFNHAKCNGDGEEDKKVVSLQLDKEHHALFIAFSSCIVRIPLSRCERHGSCKKTCIASRDPYCGWLAHGSCGRVRASMLLSLFVSYNHSIGGYEQDVEYGNTAHLGDCHEILPTTTTPDYKIFGDPTSDMMLSSASITTVGSIPVVSPKVIGSWKPKVTGSRKFVARDDPNASDYSEPLSGVPKGVRWEVQSGDSNQMVHMNVLITCVFAAFLLGAFIAGVAVYCYRDVFVRKSRKIHKDAESAQSCTDSSGSFAKLNGLFDSPVKEYQQNIDSPKLYSNLLTGRKELPQTADTKSMLMVDHRAQPPELAALPTPESTPVLQQKTLQGMKSQMEKAQNNLSSSRKEAPLKSPQFFPSSPPPHSPLSHGHIPSAIVLPNATHDYNMSFSNSNAHKVDKKMPNVDHPLTKSSGKRDHRRSVDSRNTLNDFLKHLNEAPSNSKAIMADLQVAHQTLMLDSMGNVTEVPPKVPNREASLYSPPSTLPRNSPTKRVDVPNAPAAPMTSLERQRGYHKNSSQRHSISALPKNLNSPNGMLLSRQPSVNRGGYMTPTGGTKMDYIQGTPVSVHLQPSLSRQSSYTSNGTLPRTGIKRMPSLKPDVPPKPSFAPQTPSVRPLNKYSY
ncbi:PREDICTED: semaphorin-6D [Thamnophis sirtalis]|uniref:Semaphorin-6D n=1 Tax=Thamnophis sirtalis TaxID=35019 RepID=A0A6I9XY31_9SAUR|nr:PREDICTED: semaphorin-6D [Thamnophis sirtalis]